MSDTIQNKAQEFADATVFKWGTDEEAVYDILKQVHDDDKKIEFENEVKNVLINKYGRLPQKFTHSCLINSILKDEMSGSSLMKAEDLYQLGRETGRGSSFDYLIEGALSAFDLSGTVEKIVTGVAVAGMVALAIASAPVAAIVGAVLLVGAATYGLGSLIYNGFEYGFSENREEEISALRGLGIGASTFLSSVPFVPKGISSAKTASAGIRMARAGRLNAIASVPEESAIARKSLITAEVARSLDKYNSDELRLFWAFMDELQSLTSDEVACFAKSREELATLLVDAVKIQSRSNEIPATIPDEFTVTGLRNQIAERRWIKDVGLEDLGLRTKAEGERFFGILKQLDAFTDEELALSGISNRRQLAARILSSEKETHSPFNMDVLTKNIPIKNRFYNKTLADIRSPQGLDGSEVKALGFETYEDLAIRLTIRAFEMRSAENGALPEYFSIGALKEIANNKKAFLLTTEDLLGADRLILGHGTTSASLPGTVRAKGLMPLGEMLRSSDDACYVFGGELRYYLEYGAMHSNDTGISFQSIKFRPNDGNPLLVFYNSGELDIAYAFKGISRTASSPVDDAGIAKLTELGASDEVLSFAMRQRKGFASLSPQEQSMVEKPFPVVYQIRNYDSSKTRTIPMTAFHGEYVHDGKLLLGREITEVFVPREEVVAVERFFQVAGIEGVDVLSLDSLLTWRFLYSETYVDIMSSENRFVYSGTGLFGIDL